ncbi:MAG: DUF2634 domain-containing protein [Ruminiclostridium sp.]|nr:DUF2634 domain-containing protein [Ruminiclostridium sp.]
MIPKIGFGSGDIEITEQPTLTHRMDREKESIKGKTDETEAMKQAVYKILMTERYGSIIYSGNYGIELKDLFGQPVSYVCPELERRITDALLWDKRIESVGNFEFDLSKKGVVSVRFNVQTVFGSFESERQVNI